MYAKWIYPPTKGRTLWVGGRQRKKKGARVKGDRLARVLAWRIGVRQERAREALDDLVERLQEIFVREGRLVLPGIGRLEIRTVDLWPRLRYRARRIIDPVNYKINVVRFAPSRALYITEADEKIVGRLERAEAALRARGCHAVTFLTHCAACGRRIRGMRWGGKKRLTRHCKSCTRARARASFQAHKDKTILQSSKKMRPAQQRHRWRLLKEAALKNFVKRMGYGRAPDKGKGG